MHITELPTALLSNIVSNLWTIDIKELSITCRLFRKICVKYLYDRIIMKAVGLKWLDKPLIPWEENVKSFHAHVHYIKSRSDHRNPLSRMGDFTGLKPTEISIRFIYLCDIFQTQCFPSLNSLTLDFTMASRGRVFHGSMNVNSVMRGFRSLFSFIDKPGNNLRRLRIIFENYYHKYKTIGFLKERLAVRFNSRYYYCKPLDNQEVFLQYDGLEFKFIGGFDIHILSNVPNTPLHEAWKSLKQDKVKSFTLRMDDMKNGTYETPPRKVDRISDWWFHKFQILHFRPSLEYLGFLMEMSSQAYLPEQLSTNGKSAFDWMNDHLKSLVNLRKLDLIIPTRCFGEVEEMRPDGNPNIMERWGSEILPKIEEVRWYRHDLAARKYKCFLHCIFIEVDGKKERHQCLDNEAEDIDCS